MPQIEIMIGGRAFDVACQDGEEEYLFAAAALINNEATTLTNQIGRLPESKMLLMSGLMLADKTVGLEAQVNELKEHITALETVVHQEPKRVEVPVIPDAIVETMADLAARSEAVAQTLEDRAATVSDDHSSE